MLQRADVCLQLSFMWVVDVSASKKIKENQLSWYCSHLKCSKQLNIAFILCGPIQFSCDVRATGTCLVSKSSALPSSHPLMIYLTRI